VGTQLLSDRISEFLGQVKAARLDVEGEFRTLFEGREPHEFEKVTMRSGQLRLILTTLKDRLVGFGEKLPEPDRSAILAEAAEFVRAIRELNKSEEVFRSPRRDS